MWSESSKKTCSQAKGASCTNPSRHPAVVCGRAFGLRPMFGCRSERLGLVGRADRVETRRVAGEKRVQPVESKRARRKSLRADCIQLCAQAMALEGNALCRS